MASPAAAFNKAINDQDLSALERLMTNDHTFIDSEGNRFAGKTRALNAWRGFIKAFPGYRNIWTKVVPADGLEIAIGRSECPEEPDLDGPAIWRAKVDGNRISEWRVYEDTPENRASLGLTEHGF